MLSARRRFYPSGRRLPSDSLNASAALIKAVLITSARALAFDSSSADAACKEYAKGLLVKTCVPNYKEGWGRPNVGHVCFPPSFLSLLHPSLCTGL